MYRKLIFVISVIVVIIWMSEIWTFSHSLELSPGANSEACVTLDRIRKFGASCAYQYRKPGPDGLCEGVAPHDVKSGVNWLHKVPRGFALPSVEQVRRCPPITFASKPQRFSGIEFQCYSQNTEDGILVSLLTALGTTNKRAIEIAGGIGWENNVANLVVNFGFDALFFDGNPGNSKCAKNFFRSHNSTQMRFGQGVFWSSDFVTRDNMNDIIASTTGWSGDIDVFSLDMDGIDFWIWETLQVVSPRIVVVEIQEMWGPHEFKTRPYRADHVSPEIAAMGASISAFSWLAKKKKYRLVGCHNGGYNAFFVRNDVLGADAVFGPGEYATAGCFAHVNEAWRKILNGRRKNADKYDWIDPRECLPWWLKRWFGTGNVSHRCYI